MRNKSIIDVGYSEPLLFGDIRTLENFGIYIEPKFKMKKEITMKDFIEFSKQRVAIATKTSSIDNVFVVWSCKTLQNKKALLSTTDPGANYFEVTYNGDKKEYYIDEYKKVSNMVLASFE